MSAVRCRGERGQLTVLIIGFVVVAALLMTVVVVASKAFLTRRALSSYADGAAVTAAQAVDESAVYTGDLGEAAPLSQEQAQAAVAAYVAQNGVAGRFEGFAVTEVVVTGPGVVRVGLTAVSPVGFVNEITAGYAGGVRVTVAATPRSTVG